MAKYDPNWKQRKIKARHKKESCPTGLVGPNYVSSVDQSLKMFLVGPTNVSVGPTLKRKENQDSP